MFLIDGHYMRLRELTIIISQAIKATKSVAFDLLILELMFLFFKNTVKN